MITVNVWYQILLLQYWIRYMLINILISLMINPFQTFSSFNITGFPKTIADTGSYTISPEVLSNYDVDDFISIRVVRKNESEVGNTAFNFINSSLFLGQIIE